MRRTGHLTQTDAKVIIAMSQNGMRPDVVAEKMHYSLSNIYYHLRMIRSITGLDPQGFFELHELVQIAREILGDDYE